MTSALCVLVLSLIFKLSHKQYVTLLPKSITTAIGMGLSEELGGIVTITVAVIIVTGVIGNMFAGNICKLFHISDPVAKGVGIGSASHAMGTSKAMEMGENGTWNISIKEDLKGKFYTFNVKVNGKWLGDTPGIMAKAVGVNGKRAAELDLRSTDPEGWENAVRHP